MDRSVIVDPKLVAKLMKLGESHNIPVQYRRSTAGGTDAGKIQATRSGTKVITLAVPTRYIHSPVSVISKTDYHNALKLAKAFLKSIEEGEV